MEGLVSGRRYKLGGFVHGRESDRALVFSVEMVGGGIGDYIQR